MKVVLIGDIHLSERSVRFGHVLEVLDAVIEDAEVQAAGDALGWVLLGDLFEGQPAGTEYAALFNRIARMRRAHADHRRPVGVVLGNHEAYSALAFWEHLGVVAAWHKPMRLMLPGAGAEVLLIPYPRRGRPPFDGLEDDGTIAGSMSAAAARIAELIAHESRAGRPLIVAGHFTIEGMRVKDSEFELHTATEVVVPRAAFDGVALAAVGHIHTAQDVAPHIVGVGSLIRHSFAEAADEKSYTLVTIDSGRVSWERRPVPARGMEQIRVVWPGDVREDPSAIGDVAGDCAGKEVKVLVEIPEEQLATFDATVFDPIRDAAAHFVLEKVVIPVQRARAPEIATAMTLDDQLVAWLTATNAQIGSEDYERLSAKAAEVAG